MPASQPAVTEEADRRGPAVAVELSVVLPCLDEARTLGTCIDKAQRSMTALGVSGEVVVADNGSTDGSQQIATDLGARVVAIDRSAGALELAGEFGAEHVVTAGKGARDSVALITGGGAHVSLDAVGSAATAVASITSLRPRGRHVQVGLLPPAVGSPEAGSSSTW